MQHNLLKKEKKRQKNTIVSLFLYHDTSLLCLCITELLSHIEKHCHESSILGEWKNRLHM